MAHYNLGNALHARGEMEEAIKHYRTAIQLDPKDASAHCGLGVALKAKGKVEEAIKHYRTAIRLDPKYAQAHNNLGAALKAKGKVEEAIQHYRLAIQIDPKLAYAHTNLGKALKDKGKVEEAIQHYRQAIRLDPKYASAHYNLGRALHDKGEVEVAIRHYRTAVKLNPGYAEAHCNLGHALRRQGRFGEALAALKRGHELGSRRPGWRYPSADWVRQCKLLADLEPRLDVLLRGEDRPRDAAERLTLAQACRHRQLYAASVRFYAEAFAEQPKLAADLRPGHRHRYDAACYAALAASGRGKDADKLDGKERSRLRQQALDWLRADLAAWASLLDRGPPQDRLTARRTLRHWQRDADLAGVRDREALSKLPKEEQQAWQQLWADVEALLSKGGTPGRK
jgi:Flp pilus assembly protein TadD